MGEDFISWQNVCPIPFVNLTNKIIINWNMSYIILLSVATWSAVDRGFESWSDKTRDSTIGTCCLSAEYAALKNKNKNWLAMNRDNASEWDDMTIYGLLFRWASILQNQTNRIGHVQSGYIITVIS
jgi:hypothetical protein